MITAVKCAAIFIGTLGYAVVYNVPKRQLFFVGLTGCSGYLVFSLITAHEILACFLGACTVAIFAEIFSRARKDAATLFIIPGIIPLVPGAKLYNMVLLLMEHNYTEAANLGVLVLSYAGGIAMAILLISSTVRSIVNYRKYGKTPV